MKRSALLPDLPTMDEQGLPGFEVGNWAGLLAPAGLDPAIVKKLHDEIIAILATPDDEGAHQDARLRCDREHAGGVRQRK